MASIDEAVLAEDASLLISLLSSYKSNPSVKTPSPAATSLAHSSLILSVALASNTRDLATTNIARETLHGHLFTSPRGTSPPLQPAAAVTCTLDRHLAALSTFWNSSTPTVFHAVTPTELPTVLRTAQAHIASCHARAALLRAEAGHASSRGTQLLVEAVRDGVVAVEHDVAERAASRSAGNAAVAKTVARGNAVTAKLRLLRAQTAAERYTPTSVAALRVAAAELQRRIDDVLPRVQEVRGRVAELRTAEERPEFADIVREYRRVRKTMEEKEWSMKELGVL